MSTGKSNAKNLYIALVHYPVYDKERNIIATSITNYDLHDISRLARTFNLGAFYLVTPVQKQIDLMQKIAKHWIEGKGRKLHANRGDALSLAKFVYSIDDMIESIKEEKGTAPYTVGTTARKGYKTVSHEFIRSMLIEQKNVVIIFGTGYGLTDDDLGRFDYVLKPIEGSGEYNHLSVRSAASIIIDRIFNC